MRMSALNYLGTPTLLSCWHCKKVILSRVAQITACYMQKSLSAASSDVSEIYLKVQMPFMAFFGADKVILSSEQVRDRVNIFCFFPMEFPLRFDHHIISVYCSRW